MNRLDQAALAKAAAQGRCPECGRFCAVIGINRDAFWCRNHPIVAVTVDGPFRDEAKVEP